MRSRRNSIIAWILSVVIAVTFIPLTGGVVVAAEEGDGDSGGYYYVDEVVNLPQDVVEANKKKAKAELDAKLGVVDEGAVDAESAAMQEEFAAMEAPEETPKDALKEAKGIKAYDPEKQPITYSVVSESQDPEGMTAAESMDPTGTILVSDPDTWGQVGVYGADLTTTSFYDYNYQELLIGTDAGYPYSAKYVMDLNGTGPFTRTIDMTNYEVGIYSIFVKISNGTETQYLEAKFVPSPVFAKASNRLDNYYTYVHSFDYRYPYSDYTYYEDTPDIFMDYMKSGDANWSDLVYRLDSTDTDYVMKGLKAATTYKVRMMYGKVVYYDGGEFVVTGRSSGNASEAKTIKTAYKKPKVKSIGISKVRKIVYKWRVHYANRYYYRVYPSGYRRLIKIKPLYHTYRSYYTKFKVTVKFKKKQGVKGVCIRTIQGLYAWKNGDKTKYSQTFTVRGKKKGKKVKILVQSYRSKTYGGYSGKYKKKVRCR